MKTSRLVLAGLSIFGIIAFSGCKKDNATSPANTTTTAVTADEFQSADYQTPDLGPVIDPTVSDGINAAFDITNATLSAQPAAGCSVKPGYYCLPCLLKDLKLTDSQKVGIKGFLADYRDCMTDHFKKAHEIHVTLLKKYNTLRSQLFDAYTNNSITRKELLVKLTALRDRLITEMKNSELKIHIDAILKCRAALLRNIASVLDSNQLQMFKRWVANHR